MIKIWMRLTRRKLTTFQENIGQVKQPAEIYGRERESIKTDAKYCREILFRKTFRNTVQKYSWEIQSRNTIQKYCSEIQLRNKVEKYCWELQFRNTVENYCSEIQLKKKTSLDTFQINIGQVKQPADDCHSEDQVCGIYKCDIHMIHKYKIYQCDTNIYV